MYINFDCDVHLQVRPPPVETAPTSWPGAQKASLCTVSVHNFCTESQRRAERKGRRGRERRERQRDRAHSDSHAQQTWCTLNKMARITSEIVVQIPLEEMGPGWGIVFEFVHYKPKEKKNSGAAANRPTAQSLCPSRSPSPCSPPARPLTGARGCLSAVLDADREGAHRSRRAAGAAFAVLMLPALPCSRVE